MTSPQLKTVINSRKKNPQSRLIESLSLRVQRLRTDFPLKKNLPDVTQQQLLGCKLRVAGFSLPDWAFLKLQFVSLRHRRFIRASLSVHMSTKAAPLSFVAKRVNTDTCLPCRLHWWNNIEATHKRMNGDLPQTFGERKMDGKMS